MLLAPIETQHLALVDPRLASYLLLRFACDPTQLTQFVLTHLRHRLGVHLRLLFSAKVSIL
jgi:hypothetical protein